MNTYHLSAERADRHQLLNTSLSLLHLLRRNGGDDGGGDEDDGVL